MNLFLIGSDGNYGYMNKEGNLIIPKNFTFAQKFSEGLAAVSLDYDGYMGSGLIGYINEKGEFVIPPQFTSAEEFCNGFALVELDKGPSKKAIIDKNGEIIIDLSKYERFNHNGFSEGNLPVKQDNKWKYISLTGDNDIQLKFLDKGWVLSEKYHYFSEHFSYKNALFSEGLALVVAWRSEDEGELYGFYGYIDKTGELVIKPEYDIARPFFEGLAAVCKIEVKKAERVDAVGNPIGLEYVQEKLKWGYINTKGEVVIPFYFKEAHDFSEGLATVLPYDSEEKYGFINKSGELLIEPTFLRACDFSDGLSLVTTNITYEDDLNLEDPNIFIEDEEILEQSFIDHTGKEIIKMDQHGHIVGSFESGLAPIYDVNSQEIRYIDKKGQIVELKK